MEPGQAAEGDRVHEGELREVGPRSEAIQDRLLSELVLRDFVLGLASLVDFEVLLQHDLPICGGPDANGGPTEEKRYVEIAQELWVIAAVPPRHVQAHARESGSTKSEAVRFEVLVVHELVHGLVVNRR